MVTLPWTANTGVCKTLKLAKHLWPLGRFGQLERDGGRTHQQEEADALLLDSRAGACVCFVPESSGTTCAFPMEVITQYSFTAFYLIQITGLSK